MRNGPVITIIITPPGGVFNRYDYKINCLLVYSS